MNNITSGITSGITSKLEGTKIPTNTGPITKTGLQAVQMAASKRITMVQIGDSNARLNGFGWDHGLPHALAQSYAQWGTPLDIVGGSNDGYKEKMADTPGWLGPNTGYPPELEEYILAGDFGPWFYSGVNNGSSATGIVLNVDNPMGVNNLLRAHFAYGTFLTGGGAFSPRWRLDATPFTAIGPAQTINVQTGVWGQALTTVDLPAAVRNAPVRAQWSRPSSGTDTVDPSFLALWAMIERPDVTHGFSFNTLHGQAGATAYDMAFKLINTSDQKLLNYFSVIRMMHTIVGQTPTVVIHINSGVNDRNADNTKQPTLGPNPQTDPDSPAAYLDNMRAIIARIEEIWTLGGWNKNELSFIIVPSHVVSSVPDAELASYRAIVKSELTDPRISVVDFSELMTYEEALANSWYVTNDPVHLTQAGYENLAIRELASISA